MQLPNAENATVDDAKVRDYLLSLEHPIGRFKARVFRAAGYERETWPGLRDDLRTLALTIDVTRTRVDHSASASLASGRFQRRMVGSC